MWRKIAGILRAGILWGAGLVMLLPLVFLLMGSITQNGEIAWRVGPLFSQQGYAAPLLLPEVATVRSYIKLLMDAPDYLNMFWNSCILVFPTLALQLIVGGMAGWAFARFDFIGRRAIYIIYIVLMLLPFQVTMVPTYIVLKNIGLLDTRAGVIASQAFSTFTVFLLYRFFRGIPKTLIEAAHVDGAGEATVFMRIAAPLAAPGLLSVLVLSYIELWSLVEPPMLFLADQDQWPLSLYQIKMTTSRLGVAFAGSVITLIPPLFMFLFGQSYLEQGIQSMGTKE